jgi:hypothetical protein
MPSTDELQNARRHWREVDDLRGQLRTKLNELADLRADYERLIDTHERLGGAVFAYLEAMDLRSCMIHDSMFDEEEHTEAQQRGWDDAFDEASEAIQCLRDEMAQLVGWDREGVGHG